MKFAVVLAVAVMCTHAQQVTPAEGARAQCVGMVARMLFNLCPVITGQDQPDYDVLLESSSNEVPHLGISFRARLFGLRPRGKPDVVEVCCSRPCDMEELMSFC